MEPNVSIDRKQSSTFDQRVTASLGKRSYGLLEGGWIGILSHVNQRALVKQLIAT